MVIIFLLEPKDVADDENIAIIVHPTTGDRIEVKINDQSRPDDLKYAVWRKMESSCT